MPRANGIIGRDARPWQTPLKVEPTAVLKMCCWRILQKGKSVTGPNVCNRTVCEHLHACAFFKAEVKHLLSRPQKEKISGEAGRSFFLPGSVGGV